jgi:hypothetical protein
MRAMSAKRCDAVGFPQAQPERLLELVEEPGDESHVLERAEPVHFLLQGFVAERLHDDLELLVLLEIARREHLAQDRGREVEIEDDLAAVLLLEVQHVLVGDEDLRLRASLCGLR